MKKYKVKFTKETKGYVEIWADNEHHAVLRLHKEPPLEDELIIESENFDFYEPEVIGQYQYIGSDKQEYE